MDKSMFIFELFKNILTYIYSLFDKNHNFSNLLEDEDIYIISNDFCSCKNLNIGSLNLVKIKCKLCKTPRVINYEKEKDVYYFLENVKKKVNLIIHTSGGSCTFSDFLSYILRQRKSFVTTYIPEFALSAGSFIALSSNQLHLNWYSSMGPVDTRLDFKLNDEEEEVFSAKHIKEIKNKEDALLELKSNEARTYHNDDLFVLKSIFKKKKQRDNILKNFLNTNRSHFVKYGPVELKKFGLNVNIGIKKNVIDIFKIFKELKQD